MGRQLVLDHVLVSLRQLYARETVSDVGVDGARVRVRFRVCETEDDRVAVTKPEGNEKLDKTV